MVVSDTILKRINTLGQFARNKAKLLTDKKVTLDIVIDLRNERGQKTLGRIFVHGNTGAKKYYYQIKI